MATPYSGRVARTYDEHRLGTLKGRLVDRVEWRQLAAALQLLESASGRRAGTILDIPTGTGRMVKGRLGCDSRRVIAMDASPEMLAQAQRRGGADEWLLGSVQDIPLGDDVVDVVASVRLFGHLAPDDKVLALHEFARVARIGILVSYAGDSGWLRWRRSRTRRPLADWHPVSDDAIQAMARDAGFEIIRSSGLLGPFAETRLLVARRPR